MNLCEIGRQLFRDFNLLRHTDHVEELYTAYLKHRLSCETCPPISAEHAQASYRAVTGRGLEAK